MSYYYNILSLVSILEYINYSALHRERVHELSKNEDMKFRSSGQEFIITDIDAITIN